MADDSPHMLPFSMTELDFEISVRRYGADLEAVGKVTPDWLCPLKLPTTMHTFEIPGNVGMGWFMVRLEELAQIDPLWLGATIGLSAGGRRLAASRRVRLFLGDDPWGVDTYFRDYDGKTVWAVNIRRAPSPRDAAQPDPEALAS